MSRRTYCVGAQAADAEAEHLDRLDRGMQAEGAEQVGAVGDRVQPAEFGVAPAQILLGDVPALERRHPARLGPAETIESRISGANVRAWISGRRTG